MKIREREEARKLRKEKGLSLKRIAEELGVSKGSVSIWVRDISLTKTQMKVLDHNFKVKNSYNSRVAGAHALREQAAKRHLEWQQEGREKTKEQDPLHLMGCMLYWCEGYRKNNRNTVSLSNSDPYLVRVFVNFLKKTLSLKNEDISFKINHYDDIVSLREAEKFWLKFLSLPRKCLRKATLNHLSFYSKRKKCGSLKYGTCCVMVHKTQVIQHIFGAIQEYGGFMRQEWT